MAQNIQMNVKQEDGSYEVVYPQTLVENVIDIQDNYYTQEQTLQSSTSTLFGLGVEAVPDDILVKIKELLTSTQSTADAKAQIVTGNYMGNGQYGRNNPNRIETPGTPKLLIVSMIDESSVYEPMVAIYNMQRKAVVVLNGGSNEFTWGPNYIEWYGYYSYGDASGFQYNAVGHTYVYLILI